MLSSPLSDFIKTDNIIVSVYQDAHLQPALCFNGLVTRSPPSLLTIQGPKCADRQNEYAEHMLSYTQANGHSNSPDDTLSNFRS